MREKERRCPRWPSRIAICICMYMYMHIHIHVHTRICRRCVRMPESARVRETEGEQDSRLRRTLFAFMNHSPATSSISALRKRVRWLVVTRYYLFCVRGTRFCLHSACINKPARKRERERKIKIVAFSRRNNCSASSGDSVCLFFQNLSWTWMSVYHRKIKYVFREHLANILKYKKHFSNLLLYISLYLSRYLSLSLTLFRYNLNFLVKPCKAYKNIRRDKVLKN